MDKRRESSQTRRIRRTKVDWFGIIMMFVLLVCSLAIFARLMATKMLTTTNLVLVMADCIFSYSCPCGAISWAS